MKVFHIIIISIIISYSLNAQKVLLIDIDEGIGPATTDFIKNSIAQADDEAFEALIIRLNTPGGLLDATRDIVEAIMASDVPVIVYVAPSGSRAGSAGVFITLSAHIAAMAPGTNIGAAHPVGPGGQSDTTAMFEKVTNDAAAFVRTIAQERGKNEEWAERTVRESISSTANEAMESGAIDIIASSLDSLLKSIDGKEINTQSGKEILNTANSEIVIREKNWRENLLALISNPNIAYILLMLGFYGILFELYSPGSIFPGTLGAISILLGAYSMQMLPINYAGLGLIILAFILFIIEIYVASYGLLTIGGVVSVLLGSIMLIDSPVEFMDISLSLIITVTIVTGIFFGWLIYYGIKAQFRRKSAGGNNFQGEVGKAKTDIFPDKEGNIYIHGEIWKAYSDEEIKVNDEVEIISVDGFKLKVKKRN